MVLALRSPRFDPMPICTRCGMPQGAASQATRARRVSLDGRICWAFGLSWIDRTTLGGVLTDSSAFYKPRWPPGVPTALSEIGLVEQPRGGRRSEQRCRRLVAAQVPVDERDHVAQDEGVRLGLRQRRRRIAIG